MRTDQRHCHRRNGHVEDKEYRPNPVRFQVFVIKTARQTATRSGSGSQFSVPGSWFLVPGSRFSVLSPRHPLRRLEDTLLDQPQDAVGTDRQRTNCHRASDDLLRIAAAHPIEQQ